MHLPVKFDVDDAGRLLVFGLDDLPPDKAADLRADIQRLKKSIIADIFEVKTRLAEIVRKYSDTTLTETQRAELSHEGSLLIKYLPDPVVKCIFDEN